MSSISKSLYLRLVESPAAAHKENNGVDARTTKPKTSHATVLSVKTVCLTRLAVIKQHAQLKPEDIQVTDHVHCHKPGFKPMYTDILYD